MPGAFSVQAPEILGCDDHDFITPMHGHMLWPFAANTPYQFTEPRLGILEWPVPRWGGLALERWCVGLG